MATYRHPRQCPWEDTECFTYYDMLTPHEIYDVVGSQLTDMDVEVLSFLLDEIYPNEHPLNPEKWTEMARGDSGQLEVVTPPDPRLLRAWSRLPPRGSPCPEASRHRPKCGVELLLELEQRGHLSEANLEPLLRLLRVLTRHDLLPFVSRKKRRTVSPERDYLVPPVRTATEEYSEEPGDCSHADTPRGCSPQHCREGADRVRSAGPVRRRRGKGRLRTPRRAPKAQVLQCPPVPSKVTCGHTHAAGPTDLWPLQALADRGIAPSRAFVDSWFKNRLTVVCQGQTARSSAHTEGENELAQTLRCNELRGNEGMVSGGNDIRPWRYTGSSMYAPPSFSTLLHASVLCLPPQRNDSQPPVVPAPRLKISTLTDIRLRVRPEYAEQDAVLRASVSSDKREPLARRLELFGRADAMLRARDLGSINCDIKFSEVSKLDAFWADYLSGALTEALRDVFLTDALRRAAGHQQLQLLVSVDQDDYEHGRRVLLDHLTHSSC
ncbi:hypothetical protein ACEWY4_027602 [Coilia grayii]|uniref:DED domain-containing protein n=1 Tax=Coilia grayii TaxID=363190 RepID=A0ABD1IS74_9TELE